jgi:hypothetical protein
LARAVRLAKFLLPNSEDLTKWIGEARRRLKWKVEDIRALLPADDKKNQKDMEKPTPRQWFLYWAVNNELKFDYGTDGVLVKGVSKPVDVVLSDFVLDTHEASVPISERMLKHAFATWFFDQKKIVIDRYKQLVAFRSGLGSSEVARFLRAITGAEDPVDLAVMKHFFWQVKRKLHGLAIEHHLMPVLFGKTGGGKSEAVGRLIKPLEELVDSPSDLSFVNDERQGFRLARAYIIFVDEMGKAERTNVEVLKRSISAPKTSWRVLGANRLTTAPNTATFIGATNRDLKELIYDPTGMRRFHQLKCLDRLDWETINSIDYVKLWASVDHAAKTPLLPVLDDLRILQEDLRAKDAVEEWLEERCNIGQKFTDATCLYQDYREFQEMQRRSVMTLKKWGERLKAWLEPVVGGEGKGWKKSSVVLYCVSLKSDDEVAIERERLRKLRPL